ncbi:DUF1176 domain-containing protein [Sphingomonas sp.]|uniref:DUF1176 domain-containing protein n=1 Tax=Sphingomonas sp. TaxID=28214 RepID=UPI0031D9B826
MIRIAVLLGLMSLAQPVAAAVTDTPRPARLTLFRDWIVACDNGGGCEAASLSPDDGMLQDAGLLVRRAADGAVSVKVADMTGKGQRAVIRIDGRPAATVALTRQAAGWVEGAPARALARALVRGRRAAILTPVARPVSLNGIAAALRYMDDRQRRAGTATALVASGRAAYHGTIPMLPVVGVVTPPPGAAPDVPAAAINDMRRRLGCAIGDGSMVSADAYRLDRRSTLVLLSCGAGAYNYLVKPLIWRAGRLSPARFDYALSFADEAEPGGAVTLVNAEWSDTGRLSSWSKGRGLGDCGDAQQFGWDGARFRLLEAASMTECRGAIDTLHVWRTRPVAVRAP